MEPRDHERLDRAAVALGRTEGASPRRDLAETPLLAALRRAGTRHVYADTASVEELEELLWEGDTQRAEVDGNTANQPLVRRVVERYVAADPPAGWRRRLEEAGGEVPAPLRAPLHYAILCGRIGNDVVRRFAAGRPWQVSLQLHMALGADPEAARRVGRLLHRMVPGAVVKVPFTPEAPHCLLVARDLEREGIPVNLTSTFSARQAVAAALLADVHLTNVFLGRLSQGLRAELLGEHVVLEAQRAIRSLRETAGVKTELIAASLREWQSLARLAGCDVFTVPCPVLRDFLAQTELAPEAIESQLETSYEERLGVAKEILERVGAERIARLHRVEPELVAFLRELRDTREYREMRDGDALAKRFEGAGFADLFHAPTPREREEARRAKLPDLDGELAQRVALDTHYSLLANADFAKYQEEIDALLGERATS